MVILTKYHDGIPKQTIAKQLGIDKGRVYRAIRRGHLTPTKPKGAKPIVSDLQIDRFIAYISSSEQTRRMTYTQVCKQLQLPISSSALDRALRTRGYRRRFDVVEMENDSLGRKSSSSASVDGPANGLSLSSAIVKASAASDEIFRDKSMPERY